MCVNYQMPEKKMQLHWYLSLLCLSFPMIILTTSTYQLITAMDNSI